MAGTYTTTVRNALRALLGTSKVADIDEGFLRLAEDVDTKMASLWTDTFAKRPAAGQNNRFFKLTDEGKLLYHDNGTTYDQLIGPGTGAAGARTARALATAFEPSGARRTEVVLSLQAKSTSGEQGATFSVKVGGQEIAKPVLVVQVTGNALRVTTTFTCLPGEKWEVVKEGVAEGTVESSYRFL